MAKKQNTIIIAGIIVLVVFFFLIKSSAIDLPFFYVWNADKSFLTNANGGQYIAGTWISVDTNDDGQLEGYAYSGSTGLLGNCYGSGWNLLGIQTPEGYQVGYHAENGPYVCQPSGSKFLRKRYYDPSLEAVTQAKQNSGDPICSGLDPGPCQANPACLLGWYDCIPFDTSTCRDIQGEATDGYTAEQICGKKPGCKPAGVDSDNCIIESCTPSWTCTEFACAQRGMVNGEPYYGEERTCTDSNGCSGDVTTISNCGCTQDVKECSDGTTLSRNPFNECQFDACPTSSGNGGTGNGGDSGTDSGTNFTDIFTQKVGGIPIWIIGVGVILLLLVMGGKKRR